MGVFGDTVLKAKEAADFVGKKTGEFMDISRTKVLIAGAEKKIDNEYRQLGKMIYKASKEKSDCTDYVNEKATAIDALFEERKSLIEKLADYKKIKVCPQCAAENAVDSDFCRKCGEKL